MKPILQFIRTTLTGGILFLLPVILLIAVINKGRLLLKGISEPLAQRLPDLVFGLDGSNLVAIVLLVIVCFIGGLLFRSTVIKRWIESLELSVLSYLPGYSLLKSIAADAVGEKSEDNLVTVLVQDGDEWKIGFMSEEHDGWCTVFFPEAPRHDSGEMGIVPASKVKKVNVPINVAAKSLKSYGKGAIHWLMKNP